MQNDYSKRAKTSNVQINLPNQYQGPQRKNYRKMYKNKSPTNIERYRYEDPNHVQYVQHIHYFQKQRNTGDYYDEEINLEKTMKNLGVKGAYFHNEFKKMKDSVEREKNYIQRSVKNTFTNLNQNRVNERLYNIEKNNNNNNSLLKAQNEKIFINYNNNIYEKQNYEGREQKKYPPKFYRNKNPSIKKNVNVEKKEKENNMQPVAQKICNIFLKGEKNKKLISVSKSGKKFVKNIEIEGNVAEGSTVQDKNIHYNSNSNPKTKNTNTDKNININIDYNSNSNSKNKNKNINQNINQIQKYHLEVNPIYNNKDNEKEEIDQREEKEEKTITVSDRTKDHYRESKKSIKNEKEKEESNEEYEEEEENVKNNDDEENHKNVAEEQEIDENGENEEEYEQEDEGPVHQDQDIVESHGHGELLDDEDGEENKDERIDDTDNENDEENKGINKEDIEELEEEEIQQIEKYSDNNDNNNNRKEIINFQLQKGNDIELEAIKEKKPIMQIQKVEAIQSNNEKSRQKKNDYTITKRR